MSKKNKQAPREAARPENKVSFDEVVALIKERKKYADWISALEAKREQTPEAVYAKVHLDYETRLQAVVEKLAAHRGALGQEQEALRGKLAEVEKQIEEQEEERSETELRAHVGELSAAALTEALRVADTELERLEARKSAIETDLERIAEFFAAVEGTGRISSPSMPKPKSGGFDELSFLNSVVGAQKPDSAAAEPAAASAPPAKAEAPKPEPAKPAPPPAPPAPKVEPPKVEPPKPPADAPPPKPVEVPSKPAEIPQADGAVVEKSIELEEKPKPAPVPRQSIAIQMAQLTIEPGSEAKAQSDLGIIKTGDELPPSILADLKPPSGGDKPLAANIASNDPFKLTAAPGNTKSLKCRECGAMNFATEWYCERCGAELSVI